MSNMMIKNSNQNSLTTRVQRLAHKLISLPQQYYRNGYGTLVALTIVISYLTILPRMVAMLWPYLLAKIPEVWLYLLVTNMINVVVFTGYNLVMIVVYKVKHPFFERYRVMNDPWPWESDPEQWRKILTNSVLVVARNALLIGPLVSTIDSLADFHIKMQLKDEPSIFVHIWQCLFFLLINDIGFYYTHRLLHHPKLYWLHKQHHDYNITVTIAAEYASPLEHIISNTIPTGLGFKMLAKYYPVHITTVMIWLVFRVFETCDGHSGYNWSWGQSQLLPFCGGGEYHYWHHRYNVGNYAGVLMVMDELMGTNEEYRKYEVKKELVEKDGEGQKKGKGE